MWVGGKFAQNEAMLPTYGQSFTKAIKKSHLTAKIHKSTHSEIAKPVLERLPPIRFLAMVCGSRGCCDKLGTAEGAGKR
jgi:hypothetical protein